MAAEPKKGSAWWTSLNPREKEDAVEPYLEKGLSNGQIAKELELGSRNKVITVSVRVYARRERENRSLPKYRDVRPAAEKKPKTKISPNSPVPNTSPPSPPSRAQQEFFDSVIIPPVVAREPTMAELAPHLYRAAPYSGKIQK